jgi:predicted transcriptional regulator
MRLDKMTDFLGIEPLRGQTDAARLVWLWLLEHQRVTISVRDLATVLGITAKTVNKSLLALEEAKLVVRTADTMPGKKGQTFNYGAKLPGESRE